MRVWSYVITTDSGAAPNYDQPAVTLAVCKPRIRRSAQIGDLVMAFNGATLARNPHSVRWAGIVSEVISLDEYWRDRRFDGKRPGRSAAPDNIYRLEGETWIQVPNSTHDSRNVQTDLSGANALVFGEVWHFADKAPELPPAFDLRVTANRRIEPLRHIAENERVELEGWLAAHNQGLPAGPKDALRSCGAAQVKDNAATPHFLAGKRVKRTSC